MRGAVGLLAVAWIVAGTQARAANEVYCAANDSNADVKLLFAVQPAGGKAVVAGSLQGSLDIHHQKVPRERRSWTLEGKTLAQYWNTGTDLRLRLFLGGGEGSVDLIIETRLRPNTDGSYAGTFQLQTTEGVRLTGRAECSAG